MSDVLIAVDPGSHRSGVAVYTDGRLTRCAKITPGRAKLDLLPRCAAIGTRIYTEIADMLPSLESGTPAVVVVEWPQTYVRGRGTRGNAGVATLPLAAVLGALVAHLPRHVEIEQVQPARWKGQIDKHTCAARARSRLDDAERLVARAGAVRDCLDVWDAIGIGLWRLGRFERHRVFPGAT